MRFIPVLLVVVLTACSQQPEPVPQPVRSIKTMVIDKRAGQQVRRISGITEAEIVTELAFQVGGRIIELEVNIGDDLSQGDLIARLDPEPYRIRIQTAEGQLNESQARMQDTKTKLEQLTPVYKKGYVSKADYDTAVANYNGAKSAVDVASSQLSLAQRDFKHTTLVAPLHGRLTEKYVEKFVEVTAGERIVQVSAEGQQKVNVNVPERLIGNIAVGDLVQVTFSTLGDPRGNGKILEGRVTEVAARANAGSVFPVTVVLTQSDPDVKPGISAEVAFTFTTAATGEAFSVPLTAILPVADQDDGLAYVYDAQSSTVQQRKVTVVNIHDNELEVIGDIKVGDIVAVAGVSFLVDGMSVKLLDPTQAQ